MPINKVAHHCPLTLIQQQLNSLFEHVKILKLWIFLYRGGVTRSATYWGVRPKSLNACHCYYSAREGELEAKGGFPASVFYPPF